MESDSAQLKSWQWGLIALGIILFIVINAFVIWIVKRKKKMTSNDDKEKKKNNESSSPSPTSTTIDEDREDDIGEGIVSTIGIKTKEEATLYGQQFAVVTPAQTALSPPRQQQRERKESNNNTVVMTLTEAVELDEEDSPQKIRGVFSLSPQHEESASANTTPESVNLSIGSNTSSRRTNTPFQGHTFNSTMWRGPTPPFTQYSPRQTSSSTS